MFEGFTLDRITVGDVTLRVRYGGSGPAVVLLHGRPRTHTTWYQVAPELAKDFTVVCPDLRGYGQSSKPAADAEHTQYSKKAMAADIAGLMSALGHDSYAVAGHDRGAQVAYRTAFADPDHEDRAAGRRLTCPMLMLWSTKDDLEDLYGDPLAIWRPWCPQVTGHGIDSTHHIAEQAPAELVAELRAFLS